MNRSKIRSLFEARRLLLNGRPPTTLAVLVQVGDRVEIRAMEPHQAGRMEVLRDDPLIVAAFKPAGLASPHRLLSVRSHRSRHPLRPPARLILNVEREISGVLLATWHPGAYRQLCDQFSRSTATRQYLALVEGSLPHDRGLLPGAAGWTYRYIRRFQRHALLRIIPPRPLQARPLQALKNAGLTPVSLQGRGPGRLAVHGAGVCLMHPRNGRTLLFDPPPTLAFRQCMARLPPLRPVAAPSSKERPAPHKGPELALRSPKEILRRRLSSTGER
ncbi:MAG: hypothetical protein ACE5ID_00275 [Acidobacteriota bacterium]